MKSLKLALLLLVGFGFAGCNHEQPIAGQGKKYVYVERDLYAELKAQITDFPVKGSAAQAADEAELRKLQKNRSTTECARANSEAVVTLESFYGKPYGELDKKQIEILNPFFDQLRNDFGNYIGQIKQGYSRLRPYDYLTDLKPCLPKETSFAYPSGHATLANFYKLVLTDLFPAKAAALSTRAAIIGKDRIIGGVHHRTDIEAGKKLGELLYAELNKSKLYHADVKKYQVMLK